METRRYREELEVSLLGMGCMRLPKADPEKDDIDEEKAQALIDYVYAQGVNYFDTAYGYHNGQSESFMGKALEKYPRDSYLLATKMPMWHVKEKGDVERIFQEQLQRCRTEYFDFYLLHSMTADNFAKSKEFGVYQFLSKMKEEGKIRRLGFSFHDKVSVLKEICDSYSWDFAQIQLNYVDWERQDAKGQYDLLTERGIPVIVMEPVRGGALADPGEAAVALFRAVRPDMSAASWAIRYAASLPNVLTVLSGMSNQEQVADNVATMTDFQPLTEGDREVIAAALDAYKKKDTLPCTGCRYCMDCPFGVDIPKMFSLYNGYAMERDKADYLESYRAQPAESLADCCQACGACVAQCPQHIAIPEKMTMIRELVEKLSAK